MKEPISSDPKDLLIELDGKAPVFESEIESLEICDSKQQEQIMHQSTVTSAATTRQRYPSH
eukprot:scaffold97472_cov23-Cyclotella_meneghiniana.AAC.1